MADPNVFDPNSVSFGPGGFGIGGGIGRDGSSLSPGTAEISPNSGSFSELPPPVGTPTASDAPPADVSVNPTSVSRTADDAAPAENNTTPGAQTQTGDSKNSMSTGDLPWAIVLMPTTSAGQGGIGNNRHSLQPESWVVGFFADGDNGQQPIIYGVIPGGPGAGSGRGADGVGGTSDTSAAPNAGAGNSGGANTEEAFKLLTSAGYGYTPEQAAGILGNLQAESKLNPGAFNPNDKGKPSEGIAQWRAERREALKRWPGGNTLAGQIAFLHHELQTSQKTAMRLLQNAKSPKDAAIAFANFEKFSGWNAARARATGGQGFDPNNGDLKNRINNAQAIYNKYAGKGGDGAASSSGTPTPPSRPLTVTPSSSGSP